MAQQVDIAIGSHQTKTSLQTVAAAAEVAARERTQAPYQLRAFGRVFAPTRQTDARLVGQVVVVADRTLGARRAFSIGVARG